MKVRALFVVLFIALVVTGVVGDRYFSQKLSESTPNTPAKIAAVPDKLFGWKFPVAKFPLTGPNGPLAYSDIRDPGGVPKGLPVRLKIPVIGVDTAIEDAYITPNGRMDVPAGTKNVAWFALGPNPGKEGSAVIGGHYGKYEENKGPTVFFNLDKLKAGDKIYIEDDKGDTLAFVVRKVQLFDRNADATPVFTSDDGLAHLNLITCEGTWNQVNDTYPDRRVVFTDAIPDEEAEPVKALTQVDTKTQARVANEPTQAAAVVTPSKEQEPTAGSDKPSQSFPQVLIQSVQSLYATPIDGVITSLLLLAIFFMIFTIIRRHYAARSSV